MKKNIKILLLISFIVLFNSLVTTKMIANSENDAVDLSSPEKVKEYIDSYSKWGKTKTNGEVEINGKLISLQVTFENREQSLENFLSEYYLEINQIQSNNNLSNLTSQNYGIYYDYIKNSGELFFADNDYLDVLAFFDIYENDDYNLEIIEYSKTLNNSRLSYSTMEDVLYDIDCISPDYNERLSNQMIMFSAKGLASLPNKTNAINYAKKYAVTPNQAYTNFANQGGDCTNFASQIARAGGMPDQVYWKPYVYSWVNAHGFAIAYGKKNQTKTWNTLASKLYPGSFIGEDFTGDGTMDHIAFITGNGPTSTQKYIAQHTTNYHRLSTNTNWPNNNSSRILWQIGNP